MNDVHETNARLIEEIEELRRTVRDLKARNKPLRLLSDITEQVADAVLATDRDYKITYVNPSFQKIYGYSRDELLGQSPDFRRAGGDGTYI